MLVKIVFVLLHYYIILYLTLNIHLNHLVQTFYKYKSIEAILGLVRLSVYPKLIAIIVNLGMFQLSSYLI